MTMKRIFLLLILLCGCREDSAELHRRDAESRNNQKRNELQTALDTLTVRQESLSRSYDKALREREDWQERYFVAIGKKAESGTVVTSSPDEVTLVDGDTKIRVRVSVVENKHEGKAGRKVE